MIRIQPAQITKNKQLSLWKSIIMDYHQSIGSFIFIPSKFEYFENSDINRRLSYIVIYQRVPFF